MSDPAIPADGQAQAASGPTTTTISILDTEGFVVTLPYVAGQTINEAEAKVLNQTRKENLGNNFRSKVRDFQEGKLIEDGAPVTLDQLLASFAELDKSYVFTIANASAARKYTPEEREARSIARDYLKQELDKVGRKIGDVPEGMEEQAWKDAIEAEIDRLADTAEVKKLAKDIIKARSKTAGLQLGSLGLAGAPAEGSGESQSPQA